MQKLMKRLVKCGYDEERARKICIDYSNNLSLIDLLFFVMSMESLYYVD